MKNVIRRFLLLHYALINFLTGLKFSYEALRMKALEGEFVYKARILKQKGYIEVFDKTGVFYGLFAVILYLLGLSWLRNKVRIALLENEEATIVNVVEDGQIHADIYAKDKEVPKHILPDALFAIVNDKYDVTTEYKLFKNAFEKLSFETTDVMNILLMYKSRNTLKPLGFWHKLLIIDADTLNEYVFKGDDVFRVKHE